MPCHPTSAFVDRYLESRGLNVPRPPTFKEYFENAIRKLEWVLQPELVEEDPPESFSVFRLMLEDQRQPKINRIWRIRQRKETCTMDGTVIREIANLANQAKPLTIMPIDERAGKIAVVKPDGTYDLIYRERSDRCHQFYTMKSLAEFIAFEAHHISRKDLDTHAPFQGVTVWIGRKEINVVLTDIHGDSYRTGEGASMQLEYSTQLKSLGQMSEPLGQADLLLLLRRDFMAGEVPPDFIAKMEQLKFKTDGSVDSRIMPGSESIGRSMGASVSGADNAMLPNDVMFGIPLYEHHELSLGLAHEIACSVLWDVRAGTVQIIPKPGEMAHVFDHVGWHIREDLIKAVLDEYEDAETHAKFFRGTF